MSMLYDRVCFIDVGRPGQQGTRVDECRITFRVDKSAYLALNSCDISLYNLSPTTRAKFTDAEDDVVVVLSAGYKDAGGPMTIAYGNIIQAYTAKQGADAVTRVILTDGRFHLADRSLELSFGAGASALDALRRIAVTHLGLRIAFEAEVQDKPFVTGWNYSGRPEAALSELCQRLGLEWKIIDGDVQFVKRGGVAAKNAAQAREIAPLISPASGLIGALEQSTNIIMGADKAWKYGWKGRCLLNPRLNPARPVALQGYAIANPTVYRVETVSHVGDTHGPDWYSEFTAWEKIA